MQRQQVLYDQGKRFQFLLLEHALRLRVCPWRCSAASSATCWRCRP